MNKNNKMKSSRKKTNTLKFNYLSALRLRQKILLICFVATFAVIGTVMLFRSRAATPPSAGISAMALDSGQQNYLGDTGRYKYIILQDYMYQSIPAIKAANPNTKILAYKNVAGTNNGCQYDDHRSSGVSYCFAKTNHPEWFLKDSSGNPFPFCDYNYLYWMDIGNIAYQTEWLNDVTANLKADGFDGVFADDVNTHPGHCMDGNQLRQYTDIQYGQAMQAFIAKVSPGLKANGLLVVGNVSADPWTSSQENIALAIAPNLTAFFREHFMRWGNTNALFSDAMWLSVMQQMDSVSANGSYLANTYSGTTDTAAMRYTRASFLLAWNGDSSSAFQYHAGCQCDNYNAEWTVDIGTPLAARYQTGGAWRREFTGGTAIVNPSSTQTITVSLGGTYTDAAGVSYTSVTLGPTTGIILKKAASGDTTPPSVQLSSPTNGSTISGTINATATASDNAGVSKVEFYIDGSLRSTSIASPYGYTWDTLTAINGSHSMYAKAYDNAGNSSNSALITVTVSNANDVTAPTVSIVSPANGAKVGRNVTINAGASDNVKVTKVEIYIDGRLLISSASSSISVKWRSSSGQHTVSAKAYDAAGNLGTTSITIYR